MHILCDPLETSKLTLQYWSVPSPQHGSCSGYTVSTAIPPYLALTAAVVECLLSTAQEVSAVEVLPHIATTTIELSKQWLHYTRKCDKCIKW